MNYGMADVMIGWGSMARGANPAQAMRVATERSAFADLFDSQVHFAGFDARAAPPDMAAAPVARPEPAVAGLPMEGGKTLAPARSVGSNGVSTMPARDADSAHTIAGSPRMSMAPAQTPVSTVRGESSIPAALRSPLDPAQCQWSRSAFAACLRDGELNIYVRDDALRDEHDVADALRQALRSMGIGPGDIKINGINTGA